MDNKIKPKSEKISKLNTGKLRIQVTLKWEKSWKISYRKRSSNSKWKKNRTSLDWWTGNENTFRNEKQNSEFKKCSFVK